jgi:hypothetical protein
MLGCRLPSVRGRLVDLLIVARNGGGGSGSSQNPSDPSIINLRGFGDLIGMDQLNGCPLDIDSIGGVAQQSESHLRGDALREADKLNHGSDFVPAGEAGNLEDHRGSGSFGSV